MTKWVQAGNGQGGGGHWDTIAFAKVYNTVFILSGSDVGGCFRSDDDGVTWLERSQGLYDSQVNEIAIDPTNNKRVMAATDGGVYRSFDLGDYWELLTSGFPAKTSGAWSGPLSRLAFDSKGKVYVGAGKPAKGSTPSHGTGLVYQSTDFGRTWTNNNIGTASCIYKILVHPTNNNKIYVATVGGFHYSGDAGATWAVRDAVDCRDLTHDGTTWLYRTNWASNLVERSNDDGVSWNDVSPSCANCQFLHLAFDGTYIYVGDHDYTGSTEGVYRSSDPSVGWTQINTYDTLGWQAAADADLIRALEYNPYTGKVYHGSSAGIYRYDPNWNQVYTDEVSSGKWQGGDTNTVCNTQVYFHPSNSNTWIYGVSDFWIQKTIDGGLSWETLTEPGDNDCRSLVIDPNDTSFLTWFAGDSPQACCNGRTWKTTDGGASWTQCLGLPVNRVWSIVVEIGNSNIVYCATADNGIYKSTDGGVNFSAANTGLTYTTGTRAVIVPDPADVATLWYCVEGAAVYKTTDRAANWSSVWANAGVGAPLAISPVNGYIYIDVSDNLYRSTDGSTFSLLYTTPAHPAHASWSGYISDIACHPSNANRIAYVFKDDPFHDQNTGRGVFYSDDGGATFSELAARLKISLKGAKCNFDTGGNIYYCTANAGLYKINTASIGNSATVNPGAF